MISASYRTPEGRRACDEQVVPSWDKNPGAKAELTKRLKPVWLRLPNSDALLSENAFFVEVDFIRRQIQRFTTGLFYHRFKEPLPLEIQMKVEKYAHPELTIPRWNEFLAQSGMRPKWEHVEPNIFSYFFPVAQQDKYNFMIFFVFYNTEFFISFSEN